MEKEWVKIYEATEEMKTDLVQQILEESEIESVVINKKDSIYKIGDIEVYVHRDYAIRAKQAIKKLKI
jgi:hypothetical protein